MFWRRKRSASSEPAKTSSSEAEQPADDPRWSDWPDALDVSNAEDVAWIRQSGDPLVWHDAALACLLFRGDPHGLLPWLAQQDALDRVTAAAMFLHGSNGRRYLEENRVEVVHGNGDAITQMLECLIRLDAQRTLADNGIGMMDGWEDDRLALVESVSGDTRAPLNILGRPINRQTARMPYCDLGEGDLMSMPYLRREMPFLFS